MKVSAFGKATIGLTAVATLGLGLCVPASAAGSALSASAEDPTASTNLGGAPIGPNTLVGVGSDTIQDVDFGLSQDFGTEPDGTLAVASWTATGTTALTYRSGGAPALHPNGSGAGYKALSESIGAIPAGADLVGIGDVDYARASGFQGTPAATVGAGIITEIPFAKDSISFAAPANSPFLKTNSGAGLTLANMADIYLGNKTYVDTVTGELLATATPNTAGDATLPIQAFLPKPGSGSRQFFLKDLNAVNNSVALGSNKGDSFQTTNGTPTADQPYIGNTLPSGFTAVDGSTTVIEHDATVLADVDSTKVAAIAPFSGAKFIGYHNGLIADPSGKTAGTDYVLVPFDSSTAGAILPFVNNGGTYSPNADYVTKATETVGSVTAKLTRDVFHIIATAAVKNPNANVKYRKLYDTFVGSGSKVCLDSATILAYGFMKNSNCGSTAQTADVASAATVTVSNPTVGVAGKTGVVNVAVASNGNGGGSVSVTINGRVRSAAIAAGQTSVNFTVATPAAGAAALTVGGGATDGFTPNLPGVAPAPIAATSFAVKKQAPTITVSAPTVSHLATTGKATVKITATGLKPTGKVTLWLKTSTGVSKYAWGNVTVNATTGVATVAYGKALAKGTYYVWVSYTGDANVGGKAATKYATLTVS